MPRRKADVPYSVERLLKEKASHSPCTYKIAGIAFSKKGNILGYCTNNHSKWQVLKKSPIGRAGTAEHCEKRLIQKFGRRVHTIVICRVGRSGNVLPIDPCPVCSKLADKYGIVIKTIGSKT